MVCSGSWCDLIWLTHFSVLAELLDEHEELMFSLLGKIEEKRNAIQVRALDVDLEEIEPDEVIQEL